MSKKDMEKHTFREIFEISAKQNGILKKDIANRLGVKRSAISQLLRIGNPKVSFLLKSLELLDCRVVVLLPNDEFVELKNEK